MKISMSMIFDSIFSTVRAYSLTKPSAECRISGILPFLPDMPMTGDHAYVISAQNLPDAASGDDIFLIIYGSADPEELSALNCQYMALHPTISFGEALAIALSAMEKYSQWHERLQTVLAESGDLQQICSIGFELLNNPIMLFDPDHALLASSNAGDGVSPYLEQRDDSTLMLSDDAFKTIVNRPEYEDYIELGTVSHMENPLGGNTLYSNIVRDRHQYRLCVNDTNRGFRPGDPQICKLLSDALQAAMDRDHSRETAAKAELCDLFVDLLERREVEPLTCERVLGAWNWNRSDRYICLSVEKTNTNLRFVANDQYICSKIEELLSDACAFMLDGRVICMVHLSGELSAESIPGKLESFLRDNIFIIGISDAFTDVANADNYYREACIALRFGRTDAPDMFFHSFSDYAFRHLLLEGLDGLPPVCYCDGNVRRLAAMQDSRVDYCETLRTYIENDRNLLRTAELLHIHRTTLFYRLNKIKEELDTDLDDPLTRLKIWISFILLEYEKSAEA